MPMPFVPKETKQKVEAVYKTLYLTTETAERLQKIADENKMSFNSVVVSMIEHCLEEHNNRHESVAVVFTPPVHPGTRIA